MPCADIPNSFKVYTVSAKVLHEADGEQTSALAGMMASAVRIVVRPRASGPRRLRIPASSREIVSGEFFFEGDHSVSGLPTDSSGDDGDPLRGVLNQRDFFRRGMDQARGRGADPGIGLKPLVVMEAAGTRVRPRQPCDGFRSPAAQGRDGGVI